jgi:prepilin-type processing-associated H-X9-DG protein
MKNRINVTKKDMVIVFACAVFLLVNIAAIGTGGRERAKRTVCLSNIKSLTSAWIIYADENDDKIVNGDTEEFSSDRVSNRCWVLKDWAAGMTLDDKINAIKGGALFPYCNDVRLYKCPISGLLKDLRSYSVVDAMNCKGWDAKRVIFKKRSQIKKPAGRFVFIDDGGTAGATLGGWTCYADRDEWWDPPPVLHNDGTNFSFADGHNEYWKWKDPRTVAFGKTGQAFSGPQPGNIDIRSTQVAAWGDAAIR